MRRIVLVMLVFSLIGCASLQLAPEAQRILPVSDPAECRFIKEMYIETYPETLTYSLQWNTHHAGGDAYRILSQVRFSHVLAPFSLRPSNDERVMTTHFEIYKCKP